MNSGRHGLLNAGWWKQHKHSKIVTEILLQIDRETVQVQSVMNYPVTHRNKTVEAVGKAGGILEHHATASSKTSACSTNKGHYGIIDIWEGWQDHKIVTLEPSYQLRENAPELLKEFQHILGKQNMECWILNKYSMLWPFVIFALMDHEVEWIKFSDIDGCIEFWAWRSAFCIVHLGYVIHVNILSQHGLQISHSTKGTWSSLRFAACGKLM